MGWVLGREQDRGRRKGGSTDAAPWRPPGTVAGGGNGRAGSRPGREKEAVGWGGNCFPDPVEVDGSGVEVAFGSRCV